MNKKLETKFISLFSIYISRGETLTFEVEGHPGYLGRTKRAGFLRYLGRCSWQGWRYRFARRRRSGGPCDRVPSDHAANERTYLAWVRTAIVVMGFGFLIEQFSLVIQRPNLGPKTQTAISRSLGLHVSSVAGLIMIVMGLGIIVVATARFVRMSHRISTRPKLTRSVSAPISCWQVSSCSSELVYSSTRHTSSFSALVSMRLPHAPRSQGSRSLLARIDSIFLL